MSVWQILALSFCGLMALTVAFLAGVVWGSRVPRMDEINAVADAYAWGRRDEQLESARAGNGQSRREMERR